MSPVESTAIMPAVMHAVCVLDHRNGDDMPKGQAARVPGRRARRRPGLRRALRWVALAVTGCVLLSVVQVLVLRVVDPPFSAFMA